MDTWPENYWERTYGSLDDCTFQVPSDADIDLEPVISIEDAPCRPIDGE